MCGYNRKYAIWLLQQPVRRKAKPKNKPGRKAQYQDKALIKVMQRLWLETELACSKRLKQAIPLWLPHYAKHYGELSEEVNAKLLRISPASIDRLLKPTREQLTLKRRYKTIPGKLLSQHIPFKLDTQWDTTKPGFIEADTVAHCGDSFRGDFIWSLTLTDIKSTWTEIRAVWNKGALGVMEQIQSIESTLPFLILGFNTDNGSEFLNHHLVRYFAQSDRQHVTQFSRSRPYKKNDNAHVEQKNWTHVRHLFGYVRLSKPYLVKLLNELYSHEWRLFQNFFMPTMKLIEKTRIGSRYFKKYDCPQTPYQRLLADPSVSDEQKQKLADCYSTLDPFVLRKAILAKRKRILELARSG